MEYKFLKTWVAENHNKTLTVKELRNFRDQFAILFKQSKFYLQINLQPENPFCFFSEKKILPLATGKETERWNQQLTHASLQKISMPETDRIILLTFSKTNIYNKNEIMTLILELIPRYQNMILVDEEYKILLAKRIFSYADNPVRQILPGQEYQFPPTSFLPNKEKVQYPLTIQTKIIENASSEPVFTSMNAAFTSLYYEHLFSEKIEQKRKQIMNKLQREKKKKQKKWKQLNIELLDAQKEEKWKHYAELIKANLGTIKAGAQEITVTDYYQPDLRTVTIPLQNDLSPLENMNLYFKKFRKARDGKKKIRQQMERTEQEIETLAKEEFNIAEADWQEFFEDFSKEKKKQDKTKLWKSLKWSDDWEIFVGRTSKENDILTTKFAKPHDLWFHTRVFHGTHVILRNYKKKNVPEKIKEICSRLAAYYSKAKFSENVPVDYTEIRYVRKPRGSAPGFVTYTNQKTVFVNPLDIRKARKIVENHDRITKE